MPTKRLRIVHITDIHFSKDAIEQSNSMIESLGKDLKSKIDEADDNILLITGDIANHGSDSSQYKQFLIAFEKHLNGIPVKICSIPGNHDISRKYIADNYATLLGISENIPDLEKLTSYLDKNSTSFEKAMSNYIEFEKGFTSLATCQESIYGQGHTLGSSFGLYALNSSFYSFAGFRTAKRKDDQGFLLTNIGHIKRWIHETPNIKYRILGLHHPFEWFRSDVRNALETIAYNNFGLVLFGHMHQASPIRFSTPSSNTLMAQGGAISSKESEKLFYQIITINLSNLSTELEIRHFSQTNQRFVSGSTITSTDDGKLNYSNLWQSSDQQKFAKSISQLSKQLNAALCSPVSGCDSFYVPPSITEHPLFSAEKKSEVQNFSVSTISRLAGDIVVHAPPQYGGSVLALEFAIDALRQNKKCILLSAVTAPTYKSKFSYYLEQRSGQLLLPLEGDAEVFVIDDYDSHNRNHQRLLSLIKKDYSDAKIILINRLRAIVKDQSVDNPLNKSRSFYLNALSRTRVREIVSKHPSSYLFSIDDDISSHILDEIERLNLHRIPFNVIMLMELIAENKNFSPLNRAKLVQKYFELVFDREGDGFQYEEGMDFEDRMHFLTQFTSSLINSPSFTFREGVWIEFCKKYTEKFGPKLSPTKELELYIKSNIFVRHGDIIHFRLSMWTWYFLANRVVDDPVFKKEVLESRKYQSYPQVLEFASGINREQADLLKTLGVHLDSAISEYEIESGLSSDFTPYDHMIFFSDEENIESFQADVIEQVLGSSPDRDKIDIQKDEIYDHAAPFRQIVQNQVYTENLIKLYRTLETSGLCIRNSDHVTLDERLELTLTYFRGLERFAQAAFLSIPEMVEKGSALVSGILFIPPKNRPVDNDGAAMQIIFALPSRLGQSVIEHMGSPKYWSLLAEQKAEGLSEFAKFMIICGVIELRNTNWFDQLLKYLNSLDSNSIYVELTGRLLMGTLSYGGYSDSEKRNLEKGYLATLMKQRKVKNITVDGVTKEYKSSHERINKKALGS